MSTLTTDAIDYRQHAGTCKNCGATTSGNFCQACGQATHLHVPSAREFLHEFLSHYVALEGKLWRSLKLLLFKPGFLTREYIEGRRVRYVEPLRLYLSFSIIFFFLVKLSGVEIIENETDAPPDARPAVSAPAAAMAGREVARQPQDFTEFERDVVRELGTVSPRLGKGAEKFLGLPGEQKSAAAKSAFFSYAPYAIFLLMPIFALYLKLLYLGSGRRYGEHFLFALHSNAFAFFMLSLFVVANGWDFVRFLLLLWLVAYLPTAMRRVYGGGRLVTALRWITLVALHLLSLVAAVAVAVGLVLVN
ncbi:DUF3667 domain-containing protein [Telluria aromaticivorans]|uniref:DUF3667 domain-containing protein n=1 Tax=Telluria aromaticivorans TaxID=2725995 RepID=A0A7Y2P223_9BURK|nr:DUF3667 domain-containing protein [Telluria aromaticivorans]NNG25151.1 DUF3667 domain-containing protein [Telluria aromaticivorans]